MCKSFLSNTIIPNIYNTTAPAKSINIPAAALLSPAIMPSGLNKVKNVKYFAFSAFPPTFASICNTYINAGIPAPYATLYLVSENIQEERKHMPPINKCRHNSPPFNISNAVISNSPGKLLPEQINSIIVL